MSVLYLDSSALVKLIVREAESDALLELLAGEGECASSGIARVEVLRAVRRADLGAAAVERSKDVLDRVALIAVDDEVLESASSLEPGSLRALDAIHLATALELGPALSAVVAYDERLLGAARRCGLETLSPVRAESPRSS